ncbi:MAG: hypothetical protein MJ210_03645, partial [Alphaproteobacteria bacterium]|nr:hypothetical protein [Alphaproteobacteria bacterium]
MSEKIRQFFREIFCNPINILSLLGLAFCAYQAYFAKTSPSMYEMIMVGIVVAWALLFLIRNFFKLVFILLAVAGLAYGWYYYTNRDKAACEEKGGF